MKKQILKNLIILLLAPAVGFVLLLLVHLLPTNQMKSNVISSKDSIIAEGQDELVIDDYNATLTGNFTDCIMLQLSIYDGGHSALDQAMNLYRNEVGNEEEWCPGLSLVDYLNGSPTRLEVAYPRYWHGYLVFLKPLLLFTSFNSIRLINAGLQLILLAASLILFAKKGHSKLAFSFAASLPFMFFFSSFASLSLSICMYIMLLEMLLIALFDEKLAKDEGYMTFFLLAGCATAYFDFLTFPLVTLAFPLIAFLALNEGGMKKTYLSILKYSFTWGIGYVFMWASKWIIALIFTGKNTLSDAVNTISARTSSAGDGGRIAGYIKVLKSNLSPFANRAFALLILLLGAIVLVLIIKNGLKKYFDGFASRIPTALIGLIPFVWYFVAANHSYEHAAFTCRNLAVFVFAIVFALIKDVKPTDKKESGSST
ncbi:MAG: hypothetical protein J6X80_09840 [Lachnospiraceae bacterium]|nr:hypothetical protein [Lachnospiraceae bacterium]